MSKNNVIDLSGRESGHDPLTELLRAGAERLIYQAVEAELEELVAERVKPPKCWTLNCKKFRLLLPRVCGRHAPGRVWHNHAAGAANVC